MNVALVGYGAMGQIIHNLLGNEVVAIVAKEATNGYQSLFDYQGKLDIIIDFSNPSNLDMILDYARVYKTPILFGTTGIDAAMQKKIDAVSELIPVMQSGNYSLGIILMNRLIREISPILRDNFDIEIIEKHHNKKVDSPSGTANMLLASAKGDVEYEVTHGRDGYSPRSKSEIGVHSIRGGSIVGEHEVLFCGLDEVISIKHEAFSKKIFAVGAIKAARFLISQEKGLYDMEDVLFPNM